MIPVPTLGGDRSAPNNKTTKQLLLLLGSHAARKTSFHQKLNEEGRLRRTRGLPRTSLPPPNESAWARAHESGSDGPLITITGFNHETFAYTLGLSEPFFSSYTPWVSNLDGLKFKRLKTNEKRGRKRIVTAISCLGLVLAWHRFKGAEFALQGWFGFTGNHANVWLRFGRRMLLKASQGVDDAVVRVPSDEHIEFCKAAIHKRHSSLKNVHSFADGLKLQFESCQDLEEQGMHHNGWTHGHCVTNLFAFEATGRIMDCVLNVPGSVHNSTLAVWGGTHGRMKEVYNRTGGVCAVDSAFASANAPHMIKSATDFDSANSAADTVKIQEATALRQAAEWGMRATQSSMPRLKEPIKCELKGERKRILKLVPLSHNLRLARVGLNQITNACVPAWSKDAGAMS